MGDDNKIHEYERVVVAGEGATAREIRVYGRGDRLILVSSPQPPASPH